MARWKALPEGLDPAVIQLTVQLRRMKDDSGLSLEQLAVRTGYSASSWERYLGGRLLPPRQAVEALAALVDADQVRPLVLLEAATDAWQSGSAERTGRRDDDTQDESKDQARDDARARGEDRGRPDRQPSEPAGVGPGSAAGPGSQRPPRYRLRTALTAVVAAAAGAAVALLCVQPQASSSIRLSSRQVTATLPPVRYTCHFTDRDGRWYAGNSTNSTNLVEVDMSGPQVAELQCLLQRAGFSPGGVDGNFGPLTEYAVIQEQQAQHLVVDGRVGPMTWEALRK
jgi:transcriptional regulator with XRE-family HTH domain